MTSSRGRSLALGDRLAVSLATAKRLSSAKETLLTSYSRTSKVFSNGHMLLSIDSYGISTTRDHIIPLWMYPYGADVGSEAILNQKQHQPSRLGGPATPIQNGSESPSTYSVEQQAPAAKPYIALLR